MKINQLYLILFFLFFLHLNSIAQENRTSKSNLNKLLSILLQDSCFQTANLGFMLADAKTGAIIISENAQKVLYPASNTKLFTTALALKILGKEHIQYSKLYVDGLINSDSTLVGNVILDGNYNPCLGSSMIHSTSDRFEFINNCINSLLKKGIKKINGSILCVESQKWPARLSSWMLEDTPYSYGCSAAQTGGFDNTYILKLALPNSSTDSASTFSVTPPARFIEFINQVRFDSLKKTELEVDVDQNYGDLTKFYITGSIKNKKDTATLELAMPNPALSLAYIFALRLKQSNINILYNEKTIQQIPNTAEQIDSIASPKLKDLIRFTNLQSNNQFAESILRMAAQKLNYNEKDLGLFLLKSWKSLGLNTHGMSLVDGSGLSRLNAISPKQLTDMLLFMYKSPYKTDFINSLPIAGVSGTLRKFGKGTVIENHVFAKTGSATGIQAYSGYLHTKTNKDLVFSIIVNQFTGQRYKMRSEIEQFLIQVINNQ